MALVACKECKKEVARSAKSCPNCGVSNPAVKAKDSILGLVVVLAIVGISISMCSDKADDSKAKVSDTKAKVSEEERAATEAARNKDLQCIGDKLTFTAGLLCGKQVERLAKNNAKWTDGTFEPKFSHFRWANQQSGVVTVIGDRVQFQNGFGAYTNMIYECDIDVNKDRAVVDVRAREGRLN